MAEVRENWGSRAGFILAAIGSAVGLGNVWRFPHECYSNGGSAFLIPYIVAMIVIGIPMLIMEFSLGHLTQLSAPGAFRKAGPKWEFVGWWPIILSFVIVCYYSAILGWCLNYLMFSFKDPLPWVGGADQAANFFEKDFLAANGTFSLGGLRTEIVFAMAVIWTLMFLCIFRGVKVVSKIVLWTVPIPWLMLIILMCRGLTLPGAINGLEYFLEPDFSVLKDPHIWKAAFGQVFFSMTLAFGVMVTYASFLHRKSDLNNNALIIGIADLATSVIAGIAVFATMGAIALKTGKPVDQILEGSASTGLAFVAFPEALSHLPYANAFSAIFFIALLLLGIDSAFSMTEATLASILDKTGFKRVTTLTVMSIFGFGIGLLFATEGGTTWLGAIDSFVNEGTWGIMFVGLVECLVLGWFFDLKKLRAHANKNSDWQLGIWWEWTIKLVVPCILISLTIWNMHADIKGPSMQLKAGDIKNGSALVAKLKDSDNPASLILKNKLSSTTKNLIADYDGQEKLKDDFSKALTKDINSIITSDKISFNAIFIKTTKLSSETQWLLNQESPDTLRLNRWILQDIFPDEIAKSKNRGGFVVDFQGELIGKNILGLALNLTLFMLAVIFSLWKPHKNSAMLKAT